MKHVVFNEDGSVTLKKQFFTEVMEKNDLIDFTLTIETRNDQINFLNPKIRRHPK
jgi:hypothetical protein